MSSLDLMQWNWLDYIVAFIVGVSFAYGMMNGLVKEVMSLAVWVFALWISLSFADRVAVYFEPVFSNPSVRFAVGFLLLMVFVLLVGSVLSFVFTRIVAASGLSVIDRLLGGFFGFARGLLLATVLVLILSMTSVSSMQSWHNAKLLPFFQNNASMLSQYIPVNWRQYLHLQSRVLDGFMKPSMPKSITTLDGNTY